MKKQVTKYLDAEFHNFSQNILHRIVEKSYLSEDFSNCMTMVCLILRETFIPVSELTQSQVTRCRGVGKSLLEIRSKIDSSGFHYQLCQIQQHPYITV